MRAGNEVSGGGLVMRSFHKQFDRISVGTEFGIVAPHNEWPLMDFSADTELACIVNKRKKHSHKGHVISDNFSKSPQLLEGHSRQVKATYCFLIFQYKYTNIS